MESNTKGCMNCGNISCPNNKKRVSAGCGRWTSPEDKIAELEEKVEGYNRNRDRLIAMGFPTFASCKEYSAKLEKLDKAIEIMKKINAAELMKVITTAKQYEALDELECFLEAL